MTQRKAESDLAAKVVGWLESQHWDVFQEVSMGYGEMRADIVAAQGPLLWVVECKTRYGLAVLGQAWAWLPYAHFVSVAVEPTRRTRAARAFEHALHRWSGIGVLRVGACVESEAPSFRRSSPLATELRSALSHGQKAMALAGTSGGGYWTPFSETCAELSCVVAANPGIAFRDAISKVRHHYNTDATARNCLLKWARAGKVRGVEVRQDGRRITLWPPKGGAP